MNQARIASEIELTLEQCYNGCEYSKEIDRDEFCAECDGLGALANSTIATCTDCGGKGVVVGRHPMMGMMLVQMQCQRCNATGKCKTPCKKCKGSGTIKKPAIITFKIPRGVFATYQISIKSQGNIVPRDEVEEIGQQRFDIVFVVKVKPHKIFKHSMPDEDGEIDIATIANIAIDISIPFSASLLGFTKTITHLDNSNFVFGMSEQVRNGDTFIIKGKGMPRYEELMQYPEMLKMENTAKMSYGDLLVTITVDKLPVSLLTQANKQVLATMFDTSIVDGDIDNSVPYEHINKCKLREKANNMQKQYANRDSNGQGRGHQQEIPCATQ